MSARKLLDTNILGYAYDLDAPDKRCVALQLLEQAREEPEDYAISVQVLQELQVNLAKHGVDSHTAKQIIHDYAGWQVIDNTLTLLLSGLEEQSRWQLSLWDALILAAARASGATELISEDFSHGQDYAGIRAINPFTPHNGV
jgi:predicted nucleic acid-binding protein